MSQRPEVDWTRLSDLTAETISWLWPQRLARGKLTLLVGDPGLGKSRLSFDIAARITTGGLWPDRSGRAPKGSVVMLVGEDGLADTVLPGIDAMGGNSAAVYVLNVRVGDYSRPVNLAIDLAVVERGLEDLGPQLVIIDPLTAFLGKTDSYKDAEVRGLLAPLIQIIERHHVALVAVAHLNKNQQRSALYRVGGSVAFVAASRIALVLAPDPADEDRRILAPLKSNICKPAPSLAFRLPDGCIEWEPGTVDLSAEILLAAPAQDRDRPAREEAEAFLRTMLADGPIDADTIFREAAVAHISRITLKRAKYAVGATASKVGFNPSRWLWSLNAPSSPCTDEEIPFEKTHTYSRRVSEEVHMNPFDEEIPFATPEGVHEDEDPQGRYPSGKQADSTEGCEGYQFVHAGEADVPADERHNGHRTPPHPFTPTKDRP